MVDKYVKYINKKLDTFDAMLVSWFTRDKNINSRQYHNHNTEVISIMREHVKKIDEGHYGKLEDFESSREAVIYRFMTTGMNKLKGISVIEYSELISIRTYEEFVSDTRNSKIDSIIEK